MGWKRDRIDGQKVYLAILMSFLLRNEYLPEESGVDISTPVHPVAPPLMPAHFENGDKCDGSQKGARNLANVHTISFSDSAC